MAEATTSLNESVVQPSSRDQEVEECSPVNQEVQFSFVPDYMIPYVPYVNRAEH